MVLSSITSETSENSIDSIWVSDDPANGEENKNAMRLAQYVRVIYGNNFDVTVSGDNVTLKSKIYEHKSKINNKGWDDFSYIQKIDKAPMAFVGLGLMVQYSNKGLVVEEEIINARHATCDFMNYKFQQLQSKAKLDALKKNNDYYLVTLPPLHLVDDLLKSWDIKTYGKKKIVKNITFKCGR